MSDLDAPPVGFHFRIEFALLPTFDRDMCFREVSGIEASIEYTSIREGGVNDYVHRIPKRPSYGRLSLKRSLTSNSVFITWVEEALYQFKFVPLDLLISLLDGTGKPVFGWFIAGALPQKWETSGITALSSEVVVEQLDLNYQTMKRFQPIL